MTTPPPKADGEAVWKAWLRGFTQWEQTTSQLLETVLKSPSLTGPAAQALTAWMKATAQQREARTDALRRGGLATAHDQERTLHALHQLQSRVMDLQEDVAELRAEVRAMRAEDVAKPGKATRKPRTTRSKAASTAAANHKRRKGSGSATTQGEE